jgi:hypothetical protein
MRVSGAKSYYGEDVVKSIFPVTLTIIREQYFTPSLRTLFNIFDEGNTSIHGGL